VVYCKPEPVFGETEKIAVQSGINVIELFHKQKFITVIVSEYAMKR